MTSPLVRFGPRLKIGRGKITDRFPAALSKALPLFSLLPAPRIIPDDVGTGCLLQWLAGFTQFIIFQLGEMHDIIKI